MILNGQYVDLFDTIKIKRLIEADGHISAVFNDEEENEFLKEVLYEELDCQDWLQTRWNLLIFYKFHKTKHIEPDHKLMLKQYSLDGYDWTFYQEDICWNEPISNMLAEAKNFPLTKKEICILRDAHYVFSEKFAGVITHLPARDQAIIRSKTKISLANAMADLDDHHVHLDS